MVDLLPIAAISVVRILLPVTNEPKVLVVVLKVEPLNVAAELLYVPLLYKPMIGSLFSTTDEGVSATTVEEGDDDAIDHSFALYLTP